MKIIRNRIVRLFTPLVVFSLFGLIGLNAQEDEAPEVPQPPSIRNVLINFTGLSNVSEEVVRANMSIREGKVFDQIALDRDIRSLYRTRLFEFIEVRLKPLGDNSVDVIFDIRPKFRISSISFEGNESFKDRVLEAKIEVNVNQVLNERAVKADTEILKEFYLKKGFFKVRVDYQIDRNPGTGYGNITYKISEGRKFKIGKVAFEGNETIRKRKLKGKMKTKRWSFLSVFTGSGKYDGDEFEDDLERLRDHYRTQGYLDVEINPAKVEIAYPSKKKMEIRINVEEGKRYKVGSISFEGNELYNEQILQLLLRVRPGAIYKPEEIDEDIEAIEDFYGQLGYMETRVRIERVPNVATGDIDLVYRVYESEKFLVESVEIEGNTKTKSTVIVRELALGPGSTFDSVRMDASRMRLENTRFFENPNVTSKSTNIPGRKHLRVSVSEGRTGNFSFGAGFSSLEQATFFVELTQSNFDIFNWRGAFQGDGQKFRLRAQLGSYSSQILLSFEEPWLFERRLTFGFSIFDSSTNYDDVYSADSLQRGFEVYIRRRLIELIEGRLAYGITDQDFDQLSNASEAFLLRNSIGLTSRLNLNLRRDTRDRLLNTFRGARFELDFTYAGGFLGGDFDFTKIETRNLYYFPITTKHTQTIEFLLRAGSVNTFNEDEREVSVVPFEQLFFLGGPNTLRGFEYRDVGPKSGIYPTGGKSYGMVGAEYSIGFTEGFRGAIFYDGGFVNEAAGDFSVDKYWADNYGFGLRLSVMGTPLRLDYGIPLTTDASNDKGSQFNFSFGGRF